MSALTSLSVRELASQIKSQKITSEEVVRAFLKNIEEKDKQINAFLTVCADEALEQARAIDARLQKGEKLGALAGVPYAAKDIFATKNIESTGASQILKGYKPPFDATVISRLRAADAILLGKTNCDEFAQGSSGEHSAYNITRNPHDPARVPGGSSSGSAAAVAAEMCPFALGTDTGGSIRQPAALCGVTGLKVTYGRVSRSGVFAMASSLDTVGAITRNPLDTAFVLSIIAGQDPHDQTTPPVPVPDYLTEIEKNSSLQGLKIAYPPEAMSDDLDPEVRTNFESTLQKLKASGAQVDEISLPHLKYSMPVYYIICPSEVSANMERFDGLRFGPISPDAKSLLDFYTQNRARGFGDEVKRRIMIGTYTLSSGFYDAYYSQAMKVRTLIKREFESAFAKYDLLLLPTSPTPAWRLGETTSPLQEYLQDSFTIPISLAGLPAVSVPSGQTSEGLPLGIQFIGKQFDEVGVLSAAQAFLFEKK